MKSRCYNPRFPKYKDYGARGIVVCERWKNNFQNFLDDVGMPPTPKHTLERKDNEGHYEPDNVVWALPERQNRNRRSNVNLTFRGETMCIVDWAKRVGLDFSTLAYRVRRGWNVERALTTPTRGR